MKASELCAGRTYEGDDAGMAADEAVSSYLRKPYTRLITPEDDGTFRGEFLEFPGCIATGDTPAEAFENLEEAAKSWLAAEISRGHRIPAPMDNDARRAAPDLEKTRWVRLRND